MILTSLHLYAGAGGCIATKRMHGVTLSSDGCGEVVIPDAMTGADTEAGDAIDDPSSRADGSVTIPEGFVMVRHRLPCALYSSILQFLIYNLAVYRLSLAQQSIMQATRSYHLLLPVQIRLT